MMDYAELRRRAELAARTRRPPRPPFESAPRLDGRRVCPMCGEIAPGKRGWWHPACVERWHYIAFPQNAIALLVKTHGRICWGCGKRGDALIYPIELEHVRPLWSLTEAERLEHKWWLPFNLQLLCRDCHAIKTAREAKERAAIAKTIRMEAAGQVALL